MANTQNFGMACELTEDILTLHKMYDKWQYAQFKPEGIDKLIDAILEAKFIAKDLRENLIR